MNVIHKEVLGCRLDFDQGPGYYGELLAHRSARVGARAVAAGLACEHGNPSQREHASAQQHYQSSLSAASPLFNPCERRPDSYGPCVLGMRLLIRHRCPRPSASSAGSHRSGYPRFLFTSLRVQQHSTTTSRQTRLSTCFTVTGYPGPLAFAAVAATTAAVRRLR
jgi:hypothetical protein